MKLNFILFCVALSTAEEYFFTDFPQIIVDTGYAHASASVNFSYTETEIITLKYYGQVVEKLKNESNENNGSFIVALHEIVQESIKQVDFEWNELQQLVGNENKVTRFIATLGALAIGAFTVGMGLFGMLNSQDVSQIHQSVDQLELRQDHIVSHIHLQDQHLHQHDLAIIDLKDQLHVLAALMGKNNILTEMDAISLYVTTLTNRLLEQIRILKKTIIMAKYNRANPDFFSTNFLENSIKEISKLLPKFYELVSTHYIDWYNFETTMILQSDGFFLALHAPIFNPSHKFNAYYFRSLPMLMKNNNSFLMIKPEAPILGITKNKKLYIELSNLDLQNCNLISQKYICPKIKVLRKDFEKSCTFQLFQNNQAKAAPICPKIFGPRREMIVEISKNTFQFIFPNDKMVTEICPNRSQTIPIYHKKKVNISQHCHLETTSNSIFPTKSISVASKITFYKFEVIHFEHEEIPTTSNSTIDLDQFKSYHDVSKNVHVSHFKFNVALTIFSIIIAVLFIITCVCMFKRVPATYRPQE